MFDTYYTNETPLYETVQRKSEEKRLERNRRQQLRVRDLTEGFEELRKKIPEDYLIHAIRKRTYEKNFTRETHAQVDILRAATMYIKKLMNDLDT